MTPPNDGQAGFAAALRDPSLAVPRDVRRYRDDGGSRRFDVYRNNVVVSLIEALGAAFPAVRGLAGEDLFRGAARSFVAVSPPRSPVMLLYGRGFAAFLDEFPPAGAMPHLGDVARLEWAWLNAYHAAEAEPVAIDVMAGVAPQAYGNCRFRLHPSLSLVDSRWPAASLWAAATGRGPEPDAGRDRAEAAAVVRPAHEVTVTVLPAGGGAFFRAVIAGADLISAAEAAAETAPETDLSEHLRGLFDMGAVIGLRDTDEGGSVRCAN